MVCVHVCVCVCGGGGGVMEWSIIFEHVSCILGYFTFDLVNS